MGTDLSSTVQALRGLLIQDPQVNSASLSTSLSTLTQAGPLPGVPVAQQETEMVLEATGTQSAGKSLRVRTIESGHPGTDGARVVWRNDGDSLWRGWEPPTTISSWQFIDRSTTANYWKYPHSIVTSSGKIVTVAQREDQIIASFTRDATGVWGGEVEVYDKGSALTNRASPCLCLLPSGRILCFFWRERGTQASVWMYYSDDDGTSWTVGSRAALQEPISTSTYAQKRLRAAYLDGQIILLGWLTATTSEELHQWASVDLGSSFTKVDSLITAVIDYGYPDVIAHNGALVVAYLLATGSTVTPYIKRLGSAFESISGATAILATTAANAMEWGQITANVYSEGDLALWADEDGSLYVAGLDHDAAGGAKKELMIARSADDGDTWHTMGSSSSANGTGSAVWFGHDANTYPTDFCAVAAHGQTILVHRFKANPGTADDSLCQMTLGGYTTVEIPELDALDLALSNRGSWEMTWLPFDEPDNMGSSPYVWGRAVTGAPTATLGAVGLNINHSGTGQDIKYSAVPVTNDVETMAMVEVWPTAAGPTGFLQIRTTNGTNLDIDAEVTVTSGGTITLTDNNGSALGSKTGVTVTDGIQIKLAVSKPSTGKASAWYRQLGSDREWIAIATNQSCTTGTVSTATVAWGSRTGSTGNIRFVQACTTWGAYAGSGLSGGQANPSNLLGRTVMPTPVYVDDGVFLQAIDGPTFRNDVWNIDTRYTHAIDHIHPDVSPSPRKGWRSTAVTAHEIVWETSTTVTDVTQFTEDLFGLHLSRVNWRTGSFWGRASGGTWSKIFDIDTAANMNGLKFNRNGATIIPDPSGGSDATYWWPFDALADAYFDNGTQIRKVRTNTAGGWVTTATVSESRKTRLILDEYATGDLGSGTAGAIRARDITIVQPITAGTTYSAYKLVIDAQSTAEGDLRIGSALFGPVVVLGGEYGWGRGLSVTTAIQRTAGRGGTRTARQLAPTRRAVEIGWPDGLDTTPVGGDTPTAHYYRAHTGGSIVAGEGDALHSLRGVIGVLSRTDGLVTYLPRIPIKGSAQTLTIVHRDHQLLGRIMTDVHRMDVVQGEETVDEVLRGGRLRIEEEL